ncbi:hypothetical protein ACFQ1M_13540 [Sungkyunkwania multivorans]|uniref:Uncharacterized protein n=1 Tax=Sungkyunkwania multivorans TaxID=1173618 RepID=A0ABW3D0B3_9FLAO
MMKKKLEAELISIAHRVLKLKGKSDVVKLHEEVKKLYEQLTVLKFVEEHLDSGSEPVMGEKALYDTIDDVFENKNNDEVIKHNLKEYNDRDEPMEQIITPVIDTIKDIVAEMPKEETLDDILGDILPEPTFVKRDADIVTPDAKDIVTKVEVKKRSLNDKIQRGFNIGLNDRLAFVNHLFNGSQEDFNRVLSQLNTINNAADAKGFLEVMVKPDYNNWDGKEEYENRLVEIIEKKFT